MINHFSVFQPNAWDNSLSPIQILHKLINEMNNLIDVINEMEDIATDRANAYTDEQIAIVNDDLATTNNNIDQININLQASIRQLTHSIETLSSHVDTNTERINDTDERVTQNFNTFTTAMTQVYRDLNDTATQLRNYADLKDIVLKNELESEIEELRVIINNILNVKTIDGLTGLYRTVRQILSTSIIDKVKRRGGNRFAMTWGQMKIDTDNGWLAKYNYNIVQNWLIIAPTWYNFMKPTKTPVTSQSGQTRNIIPLNTWSAFVNNTALYILNLMSVENQLSSATPITGSVNELFSYFDVFDYQQWYDYKYGSTIPSILNGKHVTETAGSTTGTYKSNIKASVIRWVEAYFRMDGLYNSTASDNFLFNSSNVANLFTFILGGRTNPYDSSLFD